MPRAIDLVEALCDYSTLVIGSPVRTLSALHMYPEQELRECYAGNASAYTLDIGERADAFATVAPRNRANLYAPILGHEVSETVSWLRRALLTQNRSEAFLYCYIALESIAKRLPDLQRRELPCTKCNKET